jgi:predicted regulator of amino acid metabolism with ACT domain
LFESVHKLVSPSVSWRGADVQNILDFEMRQADSALTFILEKKIPQKLLAILAKLV